MVGVPTEWGEGVRGRMPAWEGMGLAAPGFSLVRASLELRIKIIHFEIIIFYNTIFK